MCHNSMVFWEGGRGRWGFSRQEWEKESHSRELRKKVGETFGSKKKSQTTPQTLFSKEALTVVVNRACWSSMDDIGESFFSPF